MKKGKRMVLIIAVILALAALLVYFDARLVKNAMQTSQGSQPPTAPEEEIGNSKESIHDNYDGDEGAESSQNPPEAGTDTDTDTERLIRCEAVDVDENTKEYDLELNLCEDGDHKTFIRLTYYHDGVSVINELDEGQLPELSEIFENREREQGKGQSYAIGQALLNPVQGQLYLLINGAPIDRFTQASFYMVNLLDMSVKKLFSYPGLYGKMQFSSDYGLLAYSFEDPPSMSVFQQDFLIEVYDCKNGEYLVKGNRRADSMYIGSNGAKDPEILYNYSFKSWQSSKVIQLKQGRNIKTNQDSKLQWTEMLYDVEKNLLLNMDGSEFESADQEDKGVASSVSFEPDNDDQVKTDGLEPAEVLKSFYNCLGPANDYAGAMLLLDGGFVLRIGMLKQFGVEEIHKSDIDAEYNEDNASLYSGLLKAAKLDSVTDGRIEQDGIAVVTYYQVLGLSPESQIRQPMSAKLKKIGSEWKIILIEDGNP